MGFFRKLLGRPDKDDFAQICIKALRAGGEQGAIEYDPQEFALRITDGYQVHLGNVYGEYLATPRRARHGLLARISGLPRSKTEGDFGPEVARGKLLPRVRERFYHEALRLQELLQSERPQPIKPYSTRLLNEHLTVEVVVDLTDVWATATTEKLESWGFTFDEALEIARENLWKLSGKSFERVAPGLYASSSDDAHDASRMFLHDLVWQHEVRGEHVVMPLSRSLLLVSGSDEEEGLSKMIAIAAHALQQPRAMTGMAFGLDGSVWKPWLPPRQSRLYQPFHAVATRSLLSDYAQQKELLEKLFEKTKRDIFVANVLYARNKDGSAFTMGSWGQGLESLLPQTEFIAFSQRGHDGMPRPFGFAKWEQVRQVAGELMRQTDDYPPRFHVRDFPTAEQLRAMDLTPM